METNNDTLLNIDVYTQKTTAFHHKFNVRLPNVPTPYNLIRYLFRHWKIYIINSLECDSVREFAFTLWHWKHANPSLWQLLCHIKQWHWYGRFQSCAKSDSVSSFSFVAFFHYFSFVQVHTACECSFN